MISNLFKIKNETLEQLLFGAKNDNAIKVNKDNILSKSDIAYACVNYISSTIAKMPINLYKSESDGNRVDLIYLSCNTSV